MSADDRVGSQSRAELAADLAVRGGRLALEHFYQARASVSDAQLAIRSALGREIARGFPMDGLLGGQSPREAPLSDARYEWILDAIDETHNFVRGLPGFCVSVGILREGDVFASAVYDPVARWLFTACVGRGAWLNDRALSVHGAAPRDGALCSFRTPCRTGVPDFVDDWMQRHRVRRFGSTTLDLCYIALGGLDFVHDDAASLWDIAGAAAIVLESGGVLSDDDGELLFPVTAAQRAGAPIALLAGQPAAHAAALRDIRIARSTRVSS
jgi:myo-inositol-1(or 4)-monophosphatase